MENLPDECLVEIFQYLNFKELKNLTLVCKRFNEVVSNTAKLLDEISFKIKNDADIEWNLMRKYKRINIDADEKKAVKFLKQIGDCVTHMNICKNRQYSNKIFDLCPNLKHFVTQDIAFYYINDCQPILNLESLNFKHKLNTTRFLTNVNTKKLKLYKCYGVDQTLVDFLKRQKNLEQLEFWKFDLWWELFDTDDLINADFKLKSLKLFEGKEQFNQKNFKKFLQSQTNLRKVSITSNMNNKILNILSEIGHIKELNIEGCNFKFNQMPFIENLTISERNIENSLNIAEKFPNLTSLSLYLYNHVKIVYDFANGSKKYVEIKIPKSVKTLTLNHISCENVNPFKYGDIDIENLILYDCWLFGNWLYEYLMNDGAKFNLLIIRDTLIEESHRRYFESLTRCENKKINELKLIGCEKYNKNLGINRVAVEMYSM